MNLEVSIIIDICLFSYSDKHWFWFLIPYSAYPAAFSSFLHQNTLSAKKASTSAAPPVTTSATQYALKKVRFTLAVQEGCSGSSFNHIPAITSALNQAACSCPPLQEGVENHAALITSNGDSQKEQLEAVLSPEKVNRAGTFLTTPVSLMNQDPDI